VFQTAVFPSAVMDFWSVESSVTTERTILTAHLAPAEPTVSRRLVVTELLILMSNATMEISRMETAVPILARANVVMV